MFVFAAPANSALTYCFFMPSGYCNYWNGRSTMCFFGIVLAMYKQNYNTAGDQTLQINHRAKPSCNRSNHFGQCYQIPLFCKIK